jgi:hypothetical protein
MCECLGEKPERGMKVKGCLQPEVGTRKGALSTDQALA